ncbi:hypothetical protein B9K06_14205 [Bacillus sp. OG2]|nr:hypothetical protein B9K06_14205 [Bacillus sp. OG2]
MFIIPVNVTAGMINRLDSRNKYRIDSKLIGLFRIENRQWAFLFEVIFELKYILLKYFFYQRAVQYGQLDD